MMIWQPTMKNNNNNNSGWLYINNNSNEKSVFTCGRTVEGRLGMIKFTNCLENTDEGH